MAETITLEEFKRADPRVGEVVSCERVEGTDRLPVTVDLAMKPGGWWQGLPPIMSRGISLASRSWWCAT